MSDGDDADAARSVSATSGSTNNNPNGAAATDVPAMRGRAREPELEPEPGPEAEPERKRKREHDDTLHKSRKSRGKGLRVKTGCFVCRARHLKCDETRPQCRNCQRLGRQCRYDASAAAAAPIQSIPPEGGARSSILTSSQQEIPQPSPRSSIVSTASYYSADVAPLQWLDLLAGDAGTGGRGFIVREPEANQHHKFGDADAVNAPARFPPTPAYSALSSHPSPGLSPYPISLSDRETAIFRHFVQHLGPWIDLFDPDQHFSRLVPQLAMQDHGLLKAILALSTRQLSLSYHMPSDELAPDRTLALQYYYETLHYLQHAMKSEVYVSSNELLATVLIISTYEMIDGTNKDWERHLKGVFWIQQSQDISAESSGLKQAIWWAWLRQDVWAAFRERRPILSFDTISRPYSETGHWEMAKRAVYLLGRCVSFASTQEVEAGKSNLVDRMKQADELEAMLEEWKGHLTIHFNILPATMPEGCPIKPLWINPPAFAAAVQFYHVAILLLLVHRPAAGGVGELVEREKAMSENVDAVLGLALMVTDDTAMTISTKCLFVAGVHTSDPIKRKFILDLLRRHQARSGWPIWDLGEELQVEWSRTAST